MSTIDLLDLDALRRIGLNLNVVQHLLQSPPVAGERPMRVTAVHRDRIDVHDGVHERPARCAARLLESLAEAGDALAVGDWVLARPDGHEACWVEHRIPPWTQLARRTNDGRGAAVRQVLVSNVDTALLLMGLDHDFNPRRLERYHALVRGAGVPAVVVLSKADLVDAALAERRIEQAQAVVSADMAVFALDTRDLAARDRLAPWMGAGSTLVLLGSSGAGKSTLTNTLTRPTGQTPAGQATGAVRLDDSRGRHTTTARSLHPSAGGACIIDTPGLRALRLDAGDEQAVLGAFDDVRSLAAQCRYRNCRHQGEPGCAVRGGVSEPRLNNFHKLQREAARDAMSPLQRRDERQKWKAANRAGAARWAAKRGMGED